MYDTVICLYRIGFIFVVYSSFIVIITFYVACLNHWFVDIHAVGHIVFVKSPILSVNTLSGQCVKSVDLYCDSWYCALISVSFRVRVFVFDSDPHNRS